MEPHRGVEPGPSPYEGDAPPCEPVWRERPRQDLNLRPRPSEGRALIRLSYEGIEPPPGIEPDVLLAEARFAGAWQPQLPGGGGWLVEYRRRESNPHVLADTWT